MKKSNINDFELICLSVYITSCVYLSIKPYFFSIWLVENITVWIGCAIVLYIRFWCCKLSKTSLTLITLACVFHTIGGHYGFANVPLGEYLSWFGKCGRNNFDRLGHFLCGTLIFVLLEVSAKKKFFTNLKVRFVFCFFSTAGVAAIYELLEWLDFAIAEKNHSEQFIGNTLDFWDPHADMLMCCIGALFAMISFAVFNDKLIKIPTNFKAKLHEYCE